MRVIPSRVTLRAFLNSSGSKRTARQARSTTLDSGSPDRAISGLQVRRTIGRVPTIDELSSREFIKLAKRVCTPRQLEALVLREQGVSQHTIAGRLGITDEAVRHRLMSGSRNVARALREALQTDSGREPLGKLSLLA